MAPCDSDKTGVERVLDFEFMEAIGCEYADPLGGIAWFGLLVAFAVSLSIYVRTGSPIIPIGLLMMSGGGFTWFVAPAGIQFAVLALLLVGAGVTTFIYWVFSR